MEDEQKVYIKGDPNRCDEIIKILKDLGGHNCYNCKGDAEKYLLYKSVGGYKLCNGMPIF